MNPFGAKGGRQKDPLTIRPTEAETLALAVAYALKFCRTRMGSTTGIMFRESVSLECHTMKATTQRWSNDTVSTRALYEP